MSSLNLSKMFKGWFVGDFEPTAFKTDACEVAVKSYSKGEAEDAHYHKVATEVTLIQTGKVKMLNKIFMAGDIVVIKPMQVTSFEALEDSVTVVVKVPAVKDDKYIAGV